MDFRGVLRDFSSISMCFSDVSDGRMVLFLRLATKATTNGSHVCCCTIEVQPNMISQTPVNLFASRRN